jgi:hypothetical protein
MMAITRTLGLALMILFSLSAHTAVYYVSTTGNDQTGVGTIDKPWRTIGKGLDEMEGGDTLFIRGGSYEEEPIRDRQLKDGINNDRRTVIASYPGERAIFRPNTGSGHGISSSSSRNGPLYMTFDGLTIDMALKTNMDSSLANLKLYTASHITLTNMHFINNTNGSHTQIYPRPEIGYGGNIHVVSCLFSNVQITARSDGKFPTDLHPMYWSYSPGTIIENNVFTDGHSTALAITSTASDWIVRNNHISNFKYGIHFRGEDSLLYNNVIVNPTRSGIRARGRRNVYANNTVYAEPGCGAEYGVEDHYSQITGQDSMDEVFINNIAWGAYSSAALISRSNSGQDRRSYWTNNLGISSSFLTGSIAHGNLIHPQYDPQFVEAPTNLRLTAESPARNAGAPVSAMLALDYDGFSRALTSAWDIGAFQHREEVLIDIMASAGELQWPMTISSEKVAPQDLNASAGSGYVFSPVAGSGSVRFHFEVPVAGDYVVWCRMLAPSGFIDGVHVSVNGEQPDLHYPTEGSDNVNWYWSRVNGERTGMPYGIRLFRLQAGVNWIQFSAADPFVNLSRILVTDDLGFIPEGGTRNSRVAPQVRIERKGEGTLLRWASLENKNYHVFYKDELQDAQWRRCGRDNLRVGSGSETEWVDPTEGGSGRFYLVYAAP